MNLLETFSLRGKDLDEFEKEIKEFTEDSLVIPVEAPELRFYYFQSKTADGKLSFFKIDEDALIAQERGNPRQMKDFSLSKVTKPLVDEMIAPDGSNMLMFYCGSYYYVSPGALGTLSQRAGLQCTWLRKKSLFKAEALMHGLTMNDRTCNIVVHNERVQKLDGVHTIKKVFSFMGSKYQPVPLTVIANAAKKVAGNTTVGKVSVRGWEITHRFTRIALEFPDEALAAQKAYGLPDQLIPGVVLQCSDTGDCSITAYSTFRKNGAAWPVYYDDALNQPHTKAKKGEEHTMTSEYLVEQINQGLLKNLRTLPKAMAEKMSKPVYDFDPASVPRVSRPERMPAEARANLQAIKTLIRKWSKDLQLVGVIGKAREKSLVEQMVAEIDPFQIYTEYDIAMDFLTLSDRISNISQKLRDDIAKKCKEVPFLKGIENKKAEERIVLTPDL